MEMREKIYVRMIDGVESVVPIDARSISGNLYQIMDDKEYEERHYSELFEFYPGDVVEVEDSPDLDWVHQFMAKRLISPVKHEDRDYLEFQFRCALYQIPISREYAVKYKDVIKRIKKENGQGVFFTSEYCGLLNIWKETIRKRLSKIQNANQRDEIFSIVYSNTGGKF